MKKFNILIFLYWKFPLKVGMEFVYRSVKLLVIIIKVLERYPSTIFLMQGSCLICSDF